MCVKAEDGRMQSDSPFFWGDGMEMGEMGEMENGLG